MRAMPPSPSWRSRRYGPRRSKPGVLVTSSKRWPATGAGAPVLGAAEKPGLVPIRPPGLVLALLLFALDRAVPAKGVSRIGVDGVGARESGGSVLGGSVVRRGKGDEKG